MIIGPIMGMATNIATQVGRDALIEAGNQAGPERKDGQRVGAIPVVTTIIVVIVFVIMMLNHSMTVAFFFIAPLIIVVATVIGLIIHATDKPGNSTPRGVIQDKLARAKRVESLIMPNCPTCRNPSGIGCDMRVGQGYAVLDEWSTRAHFTRIEIAVKLGLAKRADVIAQFNHQLPEGLAL